MKKKSLQDRFIGTIIPIMVLIVWFLSTQNNAVQSYVVPSPKEFAIVFFDFIFGNMQASPYSGKMLENLLISTLRVGKGFCVAGVVPGIGYLPLGMVWFGVGEENTLFLISLAAFFPVYLNTQEGASRVPEIYIRAGKMLGAKKMILFFTVIFPAAFSHVIVGLRLALGVSWAYLVLGEMTGVTKGIGAIMMDGRMLGHVDIVLACMVVIAITGKFCDWILVKLCRTFGRGLMEDSCNEG